MYEELLSVAFIKCAALSGIWCGDDGFSLSLSLSNPFFGGFLGGETVPGIQRL